ncbi:[citrate (pro-3S)-lyase] ligase [Cohaesibacter sp. ES.047]|uniref:[citrate (pro-3S)-lyase] ligase n=1 Tax=Cohaesibacter sp. ES.047 TaxID=1798205 RepID=UPI000BB87CCF|nr:[citrate (pro-3S)-lyase] ligase [Cohaesibacter sp. ES.047]SNY93194.1 [citrate (pro-3S)-lyase] ligase [Cohaesibacter sp. ES.047]
MSDGLEFETVEPAFDPHARQEIVGLLADCGLDYEKHIEAFVVCRDNGKIVACAGFEKGIIKDVAITPELRGSALSLRLVSEVVYLAQEQGHTILFVYTEPHTADFFLGCGFYPLVEVPHQTTLLENTPVGIRSYCETLTRQRVEAKKIGCVVANANPFTLGHLYLIREAAKASDWLHLFIVKEDASLFSYQDRFALAQEMTKDIPNLTLHEGSKYMISRATFPAYFFKDKGMVGKCRTAVDLLLFRKYIAPALGITHRFVGTEPFCDTTRKYNNDMMYWLQEPSSVAWPVNVVELERTQRDGIAVSASEVRRLLKAGNMDRVKKLVPEPTYNLIVEKYLDRSKRSNN